MPKKVTFKAAPGTEVGTGVNGQSVVVDFGESGVYETDNISVIDILLQIPNIELADHRRAKTEESK